MEETNLDNIEIKSGNPYVVLWSIPVFILVWVFFDITFAIIAGIFSLAFLIIAFVWLPDAEAQKLTRKIKFASARKLYDEVLKRLRKIKDQEILSEVKKALLTFKGLIDTFESKKTAQGKVEEKVLPMLRNLSDLLTRWLGHESGEYPLDREKEKKIRGVLLHFDDLILKYQNDGIDETDNYLTGLYELETDMQSAGINPEGEK